MRSEPLHAHGPAHARKRAHTHTDLVLAEPSAVGVEPVHLIVDDPRPLSAAMELAIMNDDLMARQPELSSERELIVSSWSTNQRHSRKRTQGRVDADPNMRDLTIVSAVIVITEHNAAHTVGGRTAAACPCWPPPSRTRPSPVEPEGVWGESEE